MKFRLSILVAIAALVPDLSFADKDVVKRTISSSNPFEFRKKDCFDPRAVNIKCEEGKVFKGWFIGECKNGLVQAANCADECFDPRAVNIECTDGTEFKGWIKGSCKSSLVEKADCR